MNDETIHLCADLVIELEDGHIVLARRGSEPYKGQWGLPGGKMDGRETIGETAIREAREETGLDVELVHIIGVYSDPDRDPRGRYISVAFLAKAPGGTMEAGSDAAELMKTDQPDKISLAFDHDQVIRDYLRQKK